MQSVRSFCLLVLALSFCFAGSLAAQQQAVQVPCCKCLDGQVAPINLSTGQTSPTDSLWTVNGAPATTSTSPNGNWLTSIGTGWIEPATAQSNTTYQYRTIINVPHCTIPMLVQITGQFAADNSAVLLFDGTQIASCAGPDCFSSSGGQAPVSFTIPAIQPGSHILQVNVANLGSVTGLSVRARLTVQCRQCEPCPILGYYEGANCQIGQAPAGTNAFIYNGAFYYTPLSGNQCPRPGSWFDGANCFVMLVPAGTNPFIHQNWWYLESACKPVAKTR